MNVNELIENWVDIPDYEEYYEVSDYGRIRSKNRTIKYSSGIIVNLKSHIMKPSRDMKGYCKVRLYKYGNGISELFLVQRLVASCFLDNPSKSYFVIHKDGNKNNNCAYNLKWKTKVLKEKNKTKWLVKTSITDISNGIQYDFESCQKANEFLGRNITYIFVAEREERKVLTGIDGRKYTFTVERRQ